MKHTVTTILLALVLATPASAQIALTPEVAGKLKALGSELSPDMVGGTMNSTGRFSRRTATKASLVSRDLSYGPHERNVLDVYAPTGADGTQPVLVFVHGGGFVRGDKAGQANVGRWFARHDVVTVVVNYRFAPENTWPSGAEDLRMVLEWISANAAAHKGDPSKVVLSGNSAGAMHVADYTFREDQQAENDGVIGAILISPPTVDLQGREIDPQRDALYYGADGDRAEQSVVNALDGRKIPVMVAYAQNEPGVVIDQTRILIDGLAARDGRLPLVVGVPGHNHISIVQHIGTADESLAREMLGFIDYLAMGD